MIKQTITFTDFNGEQQTRDLYFNLTEWELTELQLESPEGIDVELRRAMDQKDIRKILEFVKMLVQKGYGEKNSDGIHFEKSPEITNRFINSAMYSPLLLSLFQDEGKRVEEFIVGLMPADLVKRAIAATRGEGSQSVPQRLVPQDHLPKKETAPAEGAPIRTIDLDAPPIQVDRPADSFRVKEEPLDPIGQVIPQDDQAAYQEFRRRREAGEL